MGANDAYPFEVISKTVNSIFSVIQVVSGMGISSLRITIVSVWNPSDFITDSTLTFSITDSFLLNFFCGAVTVTSKVIDTDMKKY